MALRNNYNYYWDYLNNTRGTDKYSFLELTSATLDLTSTCLEKIHDTDEIRYKAAKCAHQLFRLILDKMGMKIVTTMVRPTSYFGNKPLTETASLLSTAAKNMTDNYHLLKETKERKIEKKTKQWREDRKVLYMTLQGDIEQYQIALQEIARMCLDDLLILNMYEKHLRRILIDRMLIIKMKPEEAISFEKRSVFPQAYYWKTLSNWLAQYLAICTPITYGKRYELREIIAIVINTTKHRIQEHGMTEEEAINEISHIMAHPGKQLDLHDYRTWAWPIQQFVEAEDYYSVFKRKYDHAPHISRRELEETLGERHRARFNTCEYTLSNSLRKGLTEKPWPGKKV